MLLTGTYALVLHIHVASVPSAAAPLLDSCSRRSLSVVLRAIKENPGHCETPY
jgi:hypothetical protein